MAYDKVQDAIREVLYETTEENIINLIKDIERYGPSLNTRDIEKIAKFCKNEYEEDRL